MRGVEQTASRRPDSRLKAEGSSEIAAAWSQSHPTDAVVCDGASHTQTFAVDQDEQGSGELEPGQAYVQFCLFGGDGAFVFSMRFAAIQ